MTSVRLGLLTCCLIFAVDPLRVAAELEEAPKRPIRYPAMTVTNELGDSLPLFSLAAYRAEFRYLRRVLHQIDLSGPAVKTDGWTVNIAEAEWPWMSCAYLGYSAINLAKADSGFRETALAEVRWLLDAMQRPRLSGFINDHFGPPFGDKDFVPSVFVHGHWLQLAARYREVSGDDRYDALMRRVATALSIAAEKSRQGILKSYKDMTVAPGRFPLLVPKTAW